MTPTDFDEVVDLLERNGFSLCEFEEKCKSGCKCWDGKKPTFVVMSGGQSPEAEWYGCAVCAINKLCEEHAKAAYDEGTASAKQQLDGEKETK